jgi:hypothetical protein
MAENRRTVITGASREPGNKSDELTSVSRKRKPSSPDRLPNGSESDLRAKRRHPEAAFRLGYLESGRIVCQRTDWCTCTKKCECNEMMSIKALEKQVNQEALKIDHRGILRIREIHLDQWGVHDLNGKYVAYDFHLVTLENIQAVLTAPLEEWRIARICAEVTSALTFFSPI